MGAALDWGEGADWDGAGCGEGLRAVGWLALPPNRVGGLNGSQQQGGGAVGGWLAGSAPNWCVCGGADWGQGQVVGGAMCGRTN